MRESTFTVVYWGFIPSFPTKGQLVEKYKLKNDQRKSALWNVKSSNTLPNNKTVHTLLIDIAWDIICKGHASQHHDLKVFCPKHPACHFWSLVGSTTLPPFHHWHLQDLPASVALRTNQGEWNQDPRVCYRLNFLHVEKSPWKSIFQLPRIADKAGYNFSCIFPFTLMFHTAGLSMSYMHVPRWDYLCATLCYCNSLRFHVLTVVWFMHS